MKDPHGDDSKGGWEAGRADAKERSTGEAGSSMPKDFDHAAREHDHSRTNNWIKSGGSKDYAKD